MPLPDPMPYRPVSVRARLATTAFILYGISLVAAVGMDLRELKLHQRVVDGGHVSEATFLSFYATHDTVYLAHLALLVACIVTFLVWLHGMSKNARALGAASMRFGPGWAVGGFFVPILNLWRPYQVVAEIWRASETGPGGGDAGLLYRPPVSPLLPAWWVAWLASGVLGSISGRLYMTAEYSEDVVESIQVNLFAYAIEGVALALVLGIVWKLTGRQRARAVALGREIPSARVVQN